METAKQTKTKAAGTRSASFRALSLDLLRRPRNAKRGILSAVADAAGASIDTAFGEHAEEDVQKRVTAIVSGVGCFLGGFTALMSGGLTAPVVAASCSSAIGNFLSWIVGRQRTELPPAMLVQDVPAFVNDLEWTKVRTVPHSTPSLPPSLLD